MYKILNRDLTVSRETRFDRRGGLQKETRGVGESPSARGTFVNLELYESRDEYVAHWRSFIREHLECSWERGK